MRRDGDATRRITKMMERSEKEFKNEVRAIVMQWSTNRKIENERSLDNAMGCNQVPVAVWDQSWGSPKECSWGSNSDEKQEPPQMYGT